MIKERRTMDRRNLLYYLQVTDATSTERVGIMVDISPGGFKLDSREPIPNGSINRLRVNITNDVASQASLVFAGRSKWCRPDHIEPSIYNVGFEVINLSPMDALIYQRVFEKYGSQTNAIGNNKDNYLWK